MTNLASGLIESLFKSFDTAVVPHARGGVIATPSYFPMAGGLGLAGEAGPEAILPLRRGSDGRLGVASDAAQPVSISFNVTASDAARSLCGRRGRDQRHAPPGGQARHDGQADVAFHTSALSRLEIVGAPAGRSG